MRGGKNRGPMQFTTKVYASLVGDNSTPRTETRDSKNRSKKGALSACWKLGAWRRLSRQR